MIIIAILMWQASHKAVALCYGKTAADLTNKVGDVDVVAGSLAYTGAGGTYVYNGTQWNPMGE